MAAREHPNLGRILLPDWTVGGSVAVGDLAYYARLADLQASRHWRTDAPGEGVFPASTVGAYSLCLAQAAPRIVVTHSSKAPVAP
jgi:hypothetical protein